ncbi:E3 ubiquitin-protein ligase TRIM7-like [Sphaerodactylus townsendi]|uniref:E3 ubiquitin-protein ligase TRIM7-like n=1 Tax=Sphaerodactylus townsendi TaxID=933632 RepID=UPI00202687FD|nr:E3 ubiquitin-protein ligase TRIM7-like [Sphaerodactylus townsendi]
MAEEGPIRELCQESTCSICLDLFRDPVLIPGCGHSFCRACLTQSWGEPAGADTSCPQCRGPAREGDLRPNQHLANIVQVTRKLRPEKGPEEAAGEKEAGGEGGVCQLHQEPLELFCREDEAPLCLVCSRSQEHRDHQVIPLEEAAGEEKPPIAAKKERVCQKHQKPLKLFCRDDEAPICVACDRSGEHQYHKIVPAEEASQEYKDQFCKCLEILRKKRKAILVYEAHITEESQDQLKRTKEMQQKTVAKFRQLHKFLEEEEKLLLARMEEVEREIAETRDQHLARFSEELSSLESLIREMEEKCQQPTGELLWDTRSTLQRYEEKAEFKFLMPTQKWPIWDVPDLNSILKVIKKQTQDTLDSGLHLQKANVALDPDTAHLALILSADRKSVRRGQYDKSRWKDPERFESSPAVLGCEGFTGGRHFWEVLVGSKGGWYVGVARKSVRKGLPTFSPEEGVWAVGKREPNSPAFIKDHDPPLSLSGELKRIRVCLNYAEQRVAFFDADRGALIHEYSGTSFSGETLLPFFLVHGEGLLKLC